MGKNNCISPTTIHALKYYFALKFEPGKQTVLADTFSVTYIPNNPTEEELHT